MKLLLVTSHHMGPDILRCLLTSDQYRDRASLLKSCNESIWEGYNAEAID